MSKIYKKLFSLVPANYLIFFFLSMCACNLFNATSLNWIPRCESTKYRNKTVLWFTKGIKKRGRHVRAWTFFIYNARRERNVWFRGFHRQAEGGFISLSMAVWCIYLQKHTIENIAVVRILNHFTFTLCTLPWIHVARTGYLSSWRKCIFFDFRPS